MKAAYSGVWRMAGLGRSSPWLMALVGLTGLGAPVGAQIVPDGTLGAEGSTVREAWVRGGMADLIEGGAARGSSLFHSFLEFGIGEGGRAYFANPQGIELIFSRVTGLSESQIDGVLGVDGTADLFLLNPNGILFGNHARLDISGSFVGSTAEKLRFADGSEFSASQPQAAPLLTTQDFNPQLWYGPIEANLTSTAPLQTGENLTLGSHQLNLTGGTIQADRDIVLQGSRRFLSGATYTVGGYFLTQDLSGQGVDFVVPHSPVIRATGNVTLNANYSGQSLYILAGGAVTHTEGTITITNPAAVNLETPSIANGAGGTQTVTVRSDGKPRLDVRSGLDWHRLGVATPVNSNTSGLGVTFSPGTSGEINFTGTALTNNSSATVGGSIFLASQVQPGSPWASTPAKGNITTGAISTRRNVFSTATTATGQDSASVQINANVGNISTGTIDTSSSIIGSGSTITRITGGNAGAIALRTTTGNLTTGSLSAISNTAALGSSAVAVTGGNGGAVGGTSLGGTLTVGNINTSSNTITGNATPTVATTLTGGAAGTVTLKTTTGSLRTTSISATSTIIARNTYGQIISGNGGANGGAVTLEAGRQISGVTVNTLSSHGQAGDVRIQGYGDLLVDQVKVLTAQQVEVCLGSTGCPPSALTPINLPGTGQAGNVTVNSLGNLTFTNSLIQSDTRAGNPAGNVTITSPGQITFQNSQIQSNTQGTGNAGSVTVTAGQGITLQNNSQITGQTTGTLVNAGQAGDLTFNAPRFTITDSSQVLAETSGAGQGGNITLNASTAVNLVQVSDTSPVLSVQTSGAGQAGNILINTPSLTLADRARITATATATATNLQSGGSIILNASQMNLAGTVGVFAETQGQSPAGTLRLNPYQADPDLQVTLTPGSQISASTSGSGNGGDFFITAPQSIFLSGAGKLAVETTGSGNAGNFQINTQNLTLTNAVQLSASTSSSGDAGDINITATTFNLDNNARVQTNTSSSGTAGNILLNTPTLQLSNGAQILAETSGLGSGGSVTVNAPNQILLGNGGQEATLVISVETSGPGRAGNITLNTPSFTLAETARITATATATATTQDGGGSIILNANTMNLAGVVGIFAETQGQAPAGTLTLQPYQNSPNLVATFFDGSTISASTSGSGNGGDFFITAPQSILLTGAGKLAVETTGSGNAGKFEIKTQNLTLTNGIEVSASTYSQAPNAGRAGDITLTSTNFTLSNGAAVRTNTFGAGDAGNIKVNASTTIDLNNGSIEAITTANSTGNGGNIDIDPIDTQIRNGGKVAVDSQGTGIGGNIRLVSGNLILDNGSISAITRSSDGGNITLSLQEWLRMNNGSYISTEAGTAGSGGKGGDVNIQARFVIAAPGSNSDIIANAFEGNGGNINIAADGIFGFEVRNTNNPRQDPRNNLTTSSRFGTSGSVEAPSVDPSQGLESLPTDLVDPSGLIDRRCSLQGQSLRASQSRFTVSGRGGLTPTPEAPVPAATESMDDLRPIEALTAASLALAGSEAASLGSMAVTAATLEGMGADRVGPGLSADANWAMVPLKPCR